MNFVDNKQVQSNPAQISAVSDLEGAVENPPSWLRDALSVPREEGFVEVDGCDIHFFRWGDKSKPGILMLHGFLAHARCFAFIAPYLAADYHVVAYDLSGMGDSGARDEYDQDIRANELLSVAEQTGLFDNAAKPTIIAHSFGGMVSSRAMETHADRFAGWIICDLMIIRPSILEANADKYGPPAVKDPNQPNRVYPDFETAKQRFRLAPPQPANEESLFDFMAFHSLKQVDGGWSWKFDPGVFRNGKTKNNNWMRIGERIAQISARKAIIYGAESALFTKDSLAYMHELSEQFSMPPIPAIDIPHARHHIMLDQPMAFVSALKSVLALWAE
jgi:pimeloyl-ACP methyl ester carboxylesterase